MTEPEPVRPGEEQGGRPAAEAPAPAGADVSASSEQTAHIETVEPPPAPVSQRRLVPPNGAPAPPRSRRRAVLAALEWALILVLLAAALYFLYRIVFPPEAPVAWKVPAQPGRWRYVVLHHSATQGGTPEAFDRFHRETRGWENGLGYHFIIGNGKGIDDGKIMMTRRWLRQMDGAHVAMAARDGANAFCIGVALVGDFEKNPPTESQLASLDRLLAFLVAEYGIEPGQVVGHGQVARKHTLCPGRLFPLPAVRETLAARTAAGRTLTGG